MELSQEQASDNSFLNNVEATLSKAQAHKEENITQPPLILESTSETSQTEAANPPKYRNIELNPQTNVAERKISVERSFKSDDSMSLDKSIGRIAEKSNNTTTEVSSSNPRRAHQRVVVSEAWDNIELYRKLKSDAQQKEKLRGGEKGNNAKSGVLHIVMQMIAKRDPLHFLGEGTLLKVFLVSSLMLFLQLKYSKKARAWFLFTLNILLYITGLTLSAGTLTLLAVKVKKYLRRDKKNVPNQLPEPAQEQQISEPVNTSTQEETVTKPN